MTGVRTIKHDFNNIFQSINAYLAAKHYDDLSDYVLKIMDECGIINTLSIINTDTFDDPGIYGIVGSKHFIATEKNIKMDLDVSISFKEISFPMPELSRILGILLDNAIEAAEKISEKYILFEAKFFKKKNATVIRVCNTYDTSININLDEIYKKGVSSKKVKSGLGLWEVKKIINRHKNSQIYTTIENNKFIQNIVIEE